MLGAAISPTEVRPIRQECDWLPHPQPPAPTQLRGHCWLMGAVTSIRKSKNIVERRIRGELRQDGPPHRYCGSSPALSAGGQLAFPARCLNTGVPTAPQLYSWRRIAPALWPPAPRPRACLTPGRLTGNLKLHPKLTLSRHSLLHSLLFAPGDFISASGSSMVQFLHRLRPKTFE